MKTVIYRLSLVTIALGVGALFFTMLVYLGDKGKGPLEDLMTSVNVSVSGLEKKLMGGKENRQESLTWLNPYANNTLRLNKPDTVFFGAYDDETVNSFKNIVALEDSLGFKLPVIQIYTAWGSKRDQDFPLLRVQAIHDLGSIPLVTWEPWLDDFDPGEFPFVDKENNLNEGGLKAIARGEFDTYIDRWANEVKEFRHPLFVRFGHEMNDPYRYPWGPQNNSPKDFIEAWTYLVDRFDSLGVANVSWVWSPHPAYPYWDYFPEGKVDWIGITALNYGTVAPWSLWWTFDDIFSKCYNDLSAYEIPFMITEFGSLPLGGNRAEWYYQALDSLPVKYPLVHSVLFFHTANDNTTTYKSLDWTIKRDKEVILSINKALEKW